MSRSKVPPPSHAAAPPQTTVSDRGYQPTAERPLDPATLKPPRGGSAIQPPRQPTSEGKK
ncbi:MAG TPA: hypothetical protein VML55_15680 [Planctomycetaceae bacterium]|nr:hypothetical protein [Planctomycetaceae bacterium]